MKTNVNLLVRFLFFSFVVAGIIIYAIDEPSLDLLMKSSGATSSDEKIIQIETVRQEALKQPIVTADIMEELTFLKSELAQLKTRLTQQSLQINLMDGDQATTLSVEDIQAINTTQADYELVNEMNQAEASDQIESYFTRQTENTDWASTHEEAIRQSLNIGQNDLASIVDLHCKSSLCRMELKYDLTAIQNDNNPDEDGPFGFSTTISSLIDSAVSREINEAEQTGVAVIFLGEADVSVSFESTADES